MTEINNNQPHIKDGGIYHPMLIDNFVTENYYLTDFNQKNRYNHTPLDFFLSNKITDPQMYELLFEKTNLKNIYPYLLGKTFEDLLFIYKNDLGKKVSKLTDIYLHHKDVQFSFVLINYNFYYQNLLSLPQEKLKKYPTDFLDYHKNCLMYNLLQILENNKKHNITFNEKQHFTLFLSLDFLDLKKDIDIISQLNLNFPKELEKYSTHDSPRRQQTLEKYEKFKTVAEKYQLSEQINFFDKKIAKSIVFKI